MSLVPLRDAKRRLQLPVDVTANDADLQAILDESEAIVLDYVTQRRDDNVAWAAIVDAWTAETLPLQVKAAILVQFGELYRFRGDDEQAPKSDYGMLNSRVTAMLYRLRDPALS